MSRTIRANLCTIALIFGCLLIAKPAMSAPPDAPRFMLWATEPIGAKNGDQCGPPVDGDKSAKLPNRPPTLTAEDIDSWNPDNGRLRLSSVRIAAKEALQLLRDHCFVLALEGRVLERGIALDPESARMTGLPTLTLYRNQDAPYLQMTSGNHGFNRRVIHSEAIDAVLGSRANLRQQFQRLADSSDTAGQALLRDEWLYAVRKLIAERKIRDGMSLEELRALLGRETSNPHGYSGWYLWNFYSPRHTNLELAADVRNGIVKSINFEHSQQLGEEPRNVFFVAIEKNDKANVKRLIASDVDVNFRDTNGISALMVAGTFADLEVLDLLITAKADVHARSADGYGALHFAVANPNIDVLARLGAAGAHVNMRSAKTGATPLHIAAKGGHLDAAYWLVAHGAKLNSQDTSGKTALMQALENRHDALAHMLIDKGADVGLKDKELNSALHIAAMQGQVNIAQSLIAKGVLINAKNRHGLTPLLMSAREYPEIAQVLITNGSAVHTADNNGVTALHLAQSVALAERLIDKGARISAIDASGDTPLSNAIVGSNARLVDLLLQKGAHGDSKFADAHNPLYLALMRRDTALAQRLIAKGARLNIVTPQGDTLLHLVAGTGFTEGAKLLISSGLDVNAKRTDGRTSLHIAEATGHREVADLLIASGANSGK